MNMGGARVTDLKKPDLKTGGDGGASANTFVIEKVENGYILRTIDLGTETETVRVYIDRSELLRDVAKVL